MHGQGHLADLVEKEAAVVCLTEFPLLAAVSPGESPLFMPEKLGLQQGLRNGCTVDFNEGASLAKTVEVNGPGDHFLTCSRLPGNQNGRLGGCNLGHRFQQAGHGLRPADEVPPIETVA